ncbi:MAG TPA: PEGA domain-containing protein [Bdellovibrionota bacterium]|nr:PEGA domain-containing protein [Bdellovibrionota bacterium]
MELNRSVRLLLPLLLWSVPALAAPQTVIELDSQPSGAAVFMDDHPYGTTPVRIANAVAPGQHLLRLERQGYQPFEKLVDVQSVTRLNIQLTPEGAKDATNPPKKPLVLERKGPPDAAGADAEGKGGGGKNAADINRLPRPDEEEPLVTEDDGSIPLQRTWIGGLWFGFNDATVAEAPGTTFASIAMSVQRRLFDRIGVQMMAALDLSPNLGPSPGGSSNERGSLRGFDLSLGAPFFPLDSGTSLLFLTPEFGISNHGYSYTDIAVDNSVQASNHYRLIQTRAGLFLNYFYMPYDRHMGSVGFGVRLGLNSYSNPGKGLTGQIATQAAAGITVRF